MPREEGPAASLASYQLEVLRDKNRELSKRLNDLFANAQENERLAVRTHQLTLSLLKQDTAAGHLACDGRLAGGGFQRRSGARRAVRAGSRTGRCRMAAGRGGKQLAPEFVPRLPEGRRAAVRSPAAGEECGSVRRARRGSAVSALLPLPGLGLVAVGSRDGNRFYPGMGTLFLRMMGEALAVAMKRFDG